MSYSETKTPAKKRSVWKYVIYIAIVLIATAISLVFSLWGDKWIAVVDAFSGADIKWLLICFAVLAASYLLDAFIYKIFCRLYTRHYKLHQGMAVSMIGAFYSDVTPSASGGQIMQAYTMKQQGIQISNAASILVMWFILYQSSLIIFDVATLIVEFPFIPNLRPIDIGSFKIPMVWVIAIGFFLNLAVIAGLYFMSFSHRIHNFILHYVIGFLGKIRVLKDPEKTRENLRVQVENFKIELRRLQVNIPVTIVIVFLFLCLLFLRNSVPYFAALSLKPFGEEYQFNFKDLFDATFLASFHQMCSGIIPLPGQAGISEYFFYYLYHEFFTSRTPEALTANIEANIAACQILWRTMTFHLVLLIGGFVSALYRSRPKEEIHVANRQTFVDLQLQTFDERKKTSDTLYETHQLSRKEVQRRIAESAGFSIASEEEKESEDGAKAAPKKRIIKEKAEKPIKRQKPPKKKKKANGVDDWDTLNIG